MEKHKTIKIAVIVLALLALGGLLWHTFTRKVPPPEEGENPSGKSFLYLYPEEEMVIYYGGSTGGSRVYVDGPGRRSPEEVSYWEIDHYYNLSPEGTLTNCFWEEEYGRLEWNRAYEVYSTRIGKLTTYWEPSYHVGHTWDMDAGWCVPGPETEVFLREVLPKTGLNETETGDVIADWLPVLEGNAYNLLAFHVDHTQAAIYHGGTGEQIGNTLRVFFLIKPLEEPMELPPQSFEPFEREGFTVVQWGGVMMR